MRLPDLREAVLRTALQVQQSGLVRGTSGNVSARDRETGLVAITPSALPFDDLAPEDIVLVDVDRSVVEGRREPSSEVPLHTAVYGARADIAAIVHTHSPFATAFAVMNRDIPEITVPLALNGRVRCLPFRLPGSDELALVIKEGVQRGGTCFLLQNHGVLCCGLDLKKALDAAVYVEEGAQVACYVLAAGGELPPIPEDLARQMREAAKKGKAL